jgi:hypothetical protein
MKGQAPFSKLSLCVVVSVASLLVYNSVRSVRSLKYVDERKVVEGIVQATRSSSSDFDTTFASAWSHSTPRTSSRTLQLDTTSSDGTTVDPIDSGSLLAEPIKEAKNQTSIADVSPLLRPVPLPFPTQQLPLHQNATTSSSSQQPLCSRQQIQSGQWVPVTLDQPPYVTKTKHLRCYPSEYYKQNFLSWDWQPTDEFCRLLPWDLPDFCRLVQAATVSIIGDSLSWEQYSSLLQLAGQRVHQNDQHRSKSSKLNHVQYACRGESKGDNTNKPTGTKFVFRNDARLTQITDSIQQDFPVVLILNRGAHYVNDTVLTDDMRETIVPAVQEWWRECQKHHLKCHLFWRTTVPGHVGCDQMKSENEDANNSSKVVQTKEAVNLTVYNTDLHRFPQPVNDLAFMEARLYNQSLYTEKQWEKFHWQDFPRQNQLVLKELSRSMSISSSSSLVPSTTDDDNDNATLSLSPLSVTIIDAYELNMLRPDEHRAHQTDCLHNCYPGKMDVYNQLLLHHLTMQRTAEDVQALQKLQQRARARSRVDTSGSYSTRVAAVDSSE